MSFPWLDTVEKILIVGGVITLLLAATAPKQLPWIRIEWTREKRITTAIVGAILIVLSLPIVRYVSIPENPQTVEQMRKKVVDEIKGNIVPRLARIEKSGLGAATNTASNQIARCNEHGLNAMNGAKETSARLQDFLIEITAFK